MAKNNAAPARLRKTSLEGTVRSRDASVGQKTARVVTFASGKGGVGKTSLLANLALELADLGKRVLLIDADLGLANIDVVLGLAPRCGLDDFFADRRGLEDIVIEGPRAVHLLPAGVAVPELSSLTVDQKMGFLSALDVFHGRYDLVLIDTAAGIADNVITFCAASEHLVIVTTPEPAALADSHALLKVLADRRDEKRFHLLVNQANDDSDVVRVYRQLIDICDDLPGVSLDVFGGIPFDRRVNAAILQSKPLAELFPDSPIRRALAGLAKRLSVFPVYSRPKGGLQFFWDKFLARGE